MVVTCSREDSTIRLWNYDSTKFRSELGRKFIFENTDESAAKPLLTVAIHPSGYYLAAGCTDKLRFFHVLHDMLRPYREIMQKMVTLLKFSEGGQYLAAAYPKHKSQSYYVSIYNCYTLEVLKTIQAHA